VGVLVDLKKSLDGSGQVNCWKQLARSASAHPDEIDLTVHFLGDREEVEDISENSRLVSHRPILSTARMGLLASPAETDLAPFHPGILASLRDRDVIHTTDAFFSLARAALRSARVLGRPLVNSIHTDIPAYTKIFSAQLIARVAGPLKGVLLDRLRFDEWCERAMRRRLSNYLARCDRVLVSNPQDLALAQAILPASRISFLRRGIDKVSYHPSRRNRSRLQERFGIEGNTFVILFVGRLDDSKNVLVFARAVRRLVEQGLPVHALLAGDGNRREEVRALLGDSGTLLGVLRPADLAWIYASSDLLVFPSETEIFPNVVVEAKASGLPPIVSSRGGSAQMVRRAGTDGAIVEGDSPEAWARAVEGLMARPDNLRRMREDARVSIEMEWPSWDDVLEEDVIPIWRAAAEARAGKARNGALSLPVVDAASWRSRASSHCPCAGVSSGRLPPAE
jgi:glycosyltransferase involved in cell wall biosynthesis